MKKKKLHYYTRQFRAARHDWARYCPDRRACFDNAKLLTEDKSFPRWECAECERSFSLSDLQCDHKIPIGNATPKTIEEYLECFKRLHSDELQILCKSCHKWKSRNDAYQKKYNAALERIGDYLGSPSSIFDYMKKWEDIQKFDKIIKKIQVLKEGSKYEKYLKQLDKLKEKYL